MSPTGDGIGIAILRGYPRHAKVLPFAGQRLSTFVISQLFSDPEYSFRSPGVLDISLGGGAARPLIP